MENDVLKHIKSKIEKLPYDLKFEVLITELLDNGILNKEDFLVRPIGNFRRGYRKDIEAIDIEKTKFKDVKVSFSLSREGLIDTLPDALFLNTRTGKKKSESITENEDAEHAARVFFLPFEQIFYQQRIDIEQKEKALIAAFTNKEGRALFARFWNLKETEVPEEYHSSLFYLLPSIYRFKGSLQELEHLYSAILRDYIKIEKIWNKAYVVPESHISPLGVDTYLGSNTVLGNKFQDGLPKLRITIGPIAKERVTEYISGSKKDKLIRFLNRILLPVEVVIEEIKVILDVKKIDKMFKLDKTEYNGRLGYSTFLSANKTEISEAS